MQNSKLQLKKLAIIILIFLGTISVPFFLIFRKVSQPVSYKSKAEQERTPDPKCSLEVEVADIAVTNTPVPPTPTSTIRPTAAATPTLCLNVAPGSGANCPASLPHPPGNVYPDVDNQTLVGSNIIPKGQTGTVNFQPNAYVKTSKLCVRRCSDSSYNNCDGNWGLTGGQACVRKDYITSLSLALDYEPGFYQLLIAGYSSDNNYACSSRLFYTAGETSDPSPVYCPLGTGCGCSNRPINVEIVE